MDDIEDFIRSNKESFEEQVPDRLKIWANIESQLPKKQEKLRFLNAKVALKIAASLLFLCVVGGILFQSVKTNDMALLQHEQEELTDINSYYSQLISHKVAQVKSSVHLTDADKTEFLRYFDELEEESRRLEKDLELNIDNEHVLAAIVENYRQRLDLLENLLNRLNRSKEKEDEKSISI
jgi:hypothetical protein